MKKAFIYADQFAKYDYGASHPLKTARLRLTYKLIRSCGLLDLPEAVLVEAVPAAEEDMLTFHDPDYIKMLKAVNGGTGVPGQDIFGLGPGDNPVFEGLYDWSRLVAGASLQAASLVDDGEASVAFNISGGLHHAMAARASGFCYINDVVLAILFLLRRGRRVAYIDIDAHHGDGVQAAFYGTDRVVTISIHESGRALFPGTGFPEEAGEGPGKGFSVNVPLPPYSDDEIFLYAFGQIVPPVLEKFRPDIVVSQLGVDSLHNDPLAHLEYTNNGFCRAVEQIRELSTRWVALGGGGYDIAAVARAWTLAWAIMNGVELPDEIPKAFLEAHPGGAFGSGRLRDERYRDAGRGREMLRAEVEKTVRLVKERVSAAFK
jgi:acetoin utilization protein AcuC